MKKTVCFVAVLALLAAPSALAGYSPVVSDMPMADWNFTHEPAAQGGAKSIEETTARDGKPSTSKQVITLDEQGEEVRSELATEGSAKSYVKTFKREGDLLEVAQSTLENGAETVYSRQKGAYAAKGKLSSISAERCLSKNELQPEGTTVVTTAADGATTLSMQDPKGKEQMKLTAAYDKNGRASRVSMAFGNQTQTMLITRNAAGLITRGASEDGKNVITTEYEMDAKGNWTKATTSYAVTRLDGKEQKFVRETVRKITY